MSEQRQTLASGFKASAGLRFNQQDRPSTKKSLYGVRKRKDRLDTCPCVLSRNKSAPTRSYYSVCGVGLSRIKEGTQCQ